MTSPSCPTRQPGYSQAVVRAPTLLLVFALCTAPAAAHEVGSNHADNVSKPVAEMVAVPAGNFTMGTDDRELADLIESCRDEFGPELGALECDNLSRLQDALVGSSRTVYLSAYLIDRYEVTSGQYRACVDGGGCDMVPLVAGDTRFIRDDLPVVDVSWTDADTYCRWAGKRLPSEAEWEKAARGTDGRRWPWGDVDGRDRANRGRVNPEELRSATMRDATYEADPSDGANALVAPGTFRWGKSPYGVYDMAGNVSEWVADWWSQYGYAGLPLVNPTGVATGGYRVSRGGGFDDPKFKARTYFRENARPGSRSISRGFRCAKTP